MDEKTSTAGLCGRVSVALALVAIAILLGNVVLVMFDVLMRAFAAHPQSWVSDIAELTYPVAIACCFPVALQTGSMIVIRALGRLGRIGWLLDVIGQLGLFALLVLFSWKVFWRGLSDWHTGYQTLTLKLQIAPTWLIVSLVLAVGALVQLHQTVTVLKRLNHAV